MQRATTKQIAVEPGRARRTGPPACLANLGRAQFGLLACLIAGTPLAQADITTYYFPHLAFGGGFQTTLTYVNYSPQSVLCETTFYSDSGMPLTVPFAAETLSSRFDGLAPGAGLHVQTAAGQTDPQVTGWAQAQCSAPIQASLLYRLYASPGVPQAEVAVNSTTAPATEFVTFAETQTGIALANPSASPANITVTALNAAGQPLASAIVTLAPSQHRAAALASLLNLNDFSGSVEITSPIPILSLSLNAEASTPANPAFSSLPPGDLPDGTPLAAQAGSQNPAAGSTVSSYYFPHLVFGSGFQTTLTLVNYSPQSVSCQSTFFSDSGVLLSVPFPEGSVSSRSDALAAGATLHAQTKSGFRDSQVTGWAYAQCTGPVKASLLYRLYNAQGASLGEASVNSMTLPDTEFATFAESKTGIALANPSPLLPATVTVTALDATGLSLGSATVQLAINAHTAANVGPLLGLKSFTGSLQVTSTVPILCLSLNAEAFTATTPVFSSMPPGDLATATPLATGH